MVTKKLVRAGCIEYDENGRYRINTVYNGEIVVGPWIEYSGVATAGNGRFVTFSEYWDNPGVLYVRVGD